MSRFVYLSAFVLALAAGCDSSQKHLTDAELQRVALTQKIELVEAGGGLVLMVGGETLSSDEVINTSVPLKGRLITAIEHFKPLAQVSDPNQFKERARSQLEEILVDKISDMLLYQYAKKQAGDGVDEALQKAAENEYRKFVLDYGGDQAKADEALEKKGIDKKRFIDAQKRKILTDSYVLTKLPTDTPITYDELKACYDQMKDKSFAKAARITFRLIDIQPAMLNATDPKADRQKLAEVLAAQLLARIESGEDFGELAKKHSHGQWKEFGGLWRPVQPASLAAPFDALGTQADKMEPGQVAGPIVVQGHVFIMKLEEKQSAGYEPFEKVQEQVEQQAAFERRKEVFERLNTEIMRQAKLGRTDKFIDFCLEQIYKKATAA